MFLLYIYIYISNYGKQSSLNRDARAHILKRGNRRIRSISRMILWQRDATYAPKRFVKKEEGICTERFERGAQQDIICILFREVEAQCKIISFFSFIVFSSLRLNQRVYCLK